MAIGSRIGMVCKANENPPTEGYTYRAYGYVWRFI